MTDSQDFRKRGFEPVITELLWGNPNAALQLPKRSTASSAGYDFFSREEIFLFPGESKVVFTDVKAYMQPGEVLLLFPRSSMGKKGLIFLNTVGVVDSDYYSNPGNDGNIGFLLKNTNPEDPLVIHEGERFAQGVFMPYLVADDDQTNTQREGGFGSTGQ